MSAERYWEARWRDEKAENERLHVEIDQLRNECARLRVLLNVTNAIKDSKIERLEGSE